MKLASIIVAAAAIVIMLSFIEADIILPSEDIIQPSSGVVYSIEWMNDYPTTQHWNVYQDEASLDNPIYNWKSDALQKHEVFLLAVDPSWDGYQIQTQNSAATVCVINSGGWAKTGECDSMTWDIRCKNRDSADKVSGCTIGVFGQDGQYAITAWGTPDGYDSISIASDSTAGWQFVPVRPVTSTAYALSWNPNYDWGVNVPFADYQKGKELYLHWDSKISDNKKFMFTLDSSGAYQLSPLGHPDFCVGVKGDRLSLIKCDNGADGFPGLWQIDCITRDSTSFYRCTIRQYDSGSDSIMYIQLRWSLEVGIVVVDPDEILSKDLWALIAV